MKLQTEMNVFFLHRRTTFTWNINKHIIYYKDKIQNKNEIQEKVFLYIF